MRRIVKLIFIASIVTYGVFLFRKTPLPAQGEVLDAVTQNEPQQEALAEQGTIVKKMGAYEYHLEPRYSYQLHGLVVSQYDSSGWFDLAHKDDPGNIKDVCVVWGENITSGAYRAAKFWSGEFTCFWQWGAGEPPVVSTAGSNNHLIPANAEIAHRIKNIAVGDQIRLTGMLADYRVKSEEGKVVYTRNTSTTRQDTGNGACEIVYVTDIEILKKGNKWHPAAKRFAGWSAVVSFILLVLAAFRPLKKIPMP